MPIYTDSRIGFPRPVSRRGVYSDMRRLFGKPCDTSHMKTITVPIIGRMYVHNKVAEGFKRVFDDILNSGMSDLIDMSDYGGTYSCRNVRGGKIYSPHSWAIAVDINVSHFQEHGKEVKRDYTNYHCRRSEIAPSLFELSKVFIKLGFTWGGWWSDKYIDPMHFEATDITVAIINGEDFHMKEAWERRVEEYSNISPPEQQVITKIVNWHDGSVLSEFEGKWKIAKDGKGDHLADRDRLYLAKR